MIKLSLKVGICTTFLFHSVMGMDNQVNEMSSIIETAMRTSPLAAKALNDEKNFREKTIQQLDELRERLQRVKDDKDPEAWQKRILAQIQKDEETTKALDEALKPFQSGVNVRFSVKTHKTAPILDGVKTLLTASFFDLLDGKTPTGYAYHQSTITILGDENKETIWGNSRGTYLKTAYLYMHSSQKEEGASKPFGNMGLDWFDNSALAHVAPLPDEIVLDLSSYSFVSPYEPGAKRGLVLPHSGYAFGGHRSEARYLGGKQFGPHDCSSWFSSFMKCPAYTTADQLCTYRKLTGSNSLVPQNWETGNDAKYLLDNMAVVDVKNPTTDIKPGQIYWVRRFASSDPEMTQLGAGGHTAITLGYLRDGNVATLGYNRDMPKMEGFGIQNFPWSSEPLKIKGLFSVKGF